MSPPVLSPWPSAPALVVSVEIGVDAPGGARTQRRTVSCGPALPRVQQVCERFGVRPTYLAGMQALHEQEVLSFLTRHHREGRCEVGALLEPHATPPYGHGDGHHGEAVEHPPTEVVSEKLVLLTDTLWQRTGLRTASLRIQGFGVTGEILAAAAVIGYAVDSSVTPGRVWPMVGGPDHRGTPPHPYHPDEQDAARPGLVPLLEVPVSTLPAGTQQSALRRLLGASSSTRHPDARLDPAALPREALVSAAETILADAPPVLHVALPANALFPGASAYSETFEEVETILASLDSLLAHAVRTHAARGRTLCQLAWIDPEVLRGAPSERELRDAQQRGDERMTRITDAIDRLV